MEGSAVLKTRTLQFEGKFRRTVPKGKGRLTFTNGLIFEGRFSGHGEARGRLQEPGGSELPALLERGILTIKRGLLRRETVAEFDTLAILTNERLH